MPETKIFPSDHPAILEMYEADPNASAIARHYGVTPHIILKVLKRHSVPIAKRPPHSKLDTLDHSAICREYDSGVPIKVLAEKYQVGYLVIRKILLRNGVKINPNKRQPRYKIPPSEHPVVVERYQSGESMRDISRCYSVRRQAISEILKKNGIQARSR